MRDKKVLVVGVGGMQILDTRTSSHPSTRTPRFSGASQQAVACFLSVYVAESGVCAYAASAVAETTDGVLRLQVRVEFDMHAFPHRLPLLPCTEDGSVAKVPTQQPLFPSLACQQVILIPPAHERPLSLPPVASLPARSWNAPFRALSSVYAFFAPEIGKLFFPKGNAALRAVETFSVFTGGYVSHWTNSFAVG